jgi:hypothetical protein
MKYNKWTVALAALGVVSFASAAKAEEKASPVMTALSTTTISGYVDTSMEWNPGTGNANLPPYKFAQGKADGFNLDVVQLRIDKPLDEGDWAAGYRVDLWFGPDAKALGTDSYLGLANLASDFAIRQAYVALRAPVGSGLDFKVGVFDSIVGYESVESGNDPNWTRSYGHSIEPQTETGILASYRFCDAFSASVGVANTIGPSINSRASSTPIPVLGLASIPTGGPEAESYKTYMGSIALTAPDSMGFLAGSTLYGGVVSGFNNSSVSGLYVPGTAIVGQNQVSYYVGATVATPVTGLRVGASWDYLDPRGANFGGQQYGMSVAAYMSYQATEKLSFHVRGEYFKDKNGVLFQDIPPSQNEALVLALTGTVQYDLWKNVISRLEVRWDHSLNGTDLFGGTEPIVGPGIPNANNAVLLAANIIYKF